MTNVGEFFGSLILLVILFMFIFMPMYVVRKEQREEEQKKEQKMEARRYPIKVISEVTYTEWVSTERPLFSRSSIPKKIERTFVDVEMEVRNRHGEKKKGKAKFDTWFWGQAKENGYFDCKEDTESWAEEK